MARLNRPSTAVLIVVVIATLSLCAHSAFDFDDGEHLDAAGLVRKALRAGLPWTYYIGDVTKREVAASLQLALCEPGKTCNGLVAQLFFTPNCEYSNTYGFLPMHNAAKTGNSSYDKCASLTTPPIGYLRSCPNGAFHKISEFANTDCSGVAHHEETLQVATCFGQGSAAANAFWCDAKDARPLSVTKPPVFDKSAPYLPNGYIICQNANLTSSRSGSKRQFGGICDSKYPIRKEANLNSTKPICAGMAPTYWLYVFGTGEPYTCYQEENMNTWLTIDKENGRMTKNVGFGCSMTEIPMQSKTFSYGCSWAQAGSDSVRLVMNGN